MSLRASSQLPLVSIPVAVLLAFVPTQAWASETIFAKWLTDDRAAIVAIERCGETLCGKIEKVLDPKAPENDVNNPDPQLRSQPLVGKQVLWNFIRSGSEWKDGRAYDPKSGNSYRSKLRLLETGKLEVTGCVLFLCKSRYWTRALRNRK